ncbi:MAG: dienelactone hydrolase family protein [Proteobacteria bacterium]|jgi:dienelactone hydrolase|nr:dienelactone hydrolase family protein [Pseudomonadota bacterium]MDA1300996.1 dienelactone hydrolase family protein [Pseudomonadota bacterium]
MIEWHQAEDTQGSPTREFRIVRNGQRDVTGAVWLPHKDAMLDTLMLFGHGASGDRYQAPITSLANRFATEAGIPVLSIDGPVHGLRQVGEGGRTAFGPEYRRDDCLSDMVTDWHAAIDATLALDEVNASRFAYLGLSMGTIFGIPLVGSLENVTAATLGLFGIHERSNHAQAHAAHAAEITCPVLYLMQLEDELFPRDTCLAAFDALASSDKRIHANPGLHPMVPAAEFRFAFDFLMQHITGGGEPARAAAVAQ